MASTMTRSIRQLRRLGPTAVPSFRPPFQLAGAGLSTNPDCHTYAWPQNNYEAIDSPVNGGLPPENRIGADLIDQTPTLQQSTDDPRTSVLMDLTDRVGALHDVLKYL